MFPLKQAQEIALLYTRQRGRGGGGGRRGRGRGGGGGRRREGKGRKGWIYLFNIYSDTRHNTYT